MFHKAFVRQPNAKTMLGLILLVVASVTGLIAAPFQDTTYAAGEKNVRQPMFWNKQGDTTVEQAAARASLVALPRVERTYRDTMRANGYTGKAVQYFLANEVHGPGPYSSSSSWCDSALSPHVNQVAYLKGDFCTYIHPNESWFLHNGAGKRLYSWSGGRVMYHMNPASSGWRNFALSRMKRDLFGDNSQTKLGFDGVILDNLELGTYKLRKQVDSSDGSIREFSSDAAYRDAMRSYLSLLSSNIRPNALIWANIIDDYRVSRDDYMSYVQYLDGWMNEAWVVGWNSAPLSDAEYNINLEEAELTLGQGKGVLTNVVGSRYDYNRQTFGLASYLLITNNSKAYFRYSDPAKYGEWWQYDNYNVALGAPLGKRYAISGGWRRDFECGYVTTTPSSRAGKIVQTSCGSTPSPTPSPSATPTPSATPAPSATPTPVAPGRIALPGKFQAEDYKAGGNNSGYMDSTSGNSGGQYRSDDVDIQRTSDSEGAYNIAYVTAGEWLAYDVNVATTGNYTFGTRVATPYSGKRFHIEVDGVDVSGSINVPNTGSWQSWRDVWTGWIPLTAGSHTIRFVAETDSFNTNFFNAIRQ